MTTFELIKQIPCSADAVFEELCQKMKKKLVINCHPEHHLLERISMLHVPEFMQMAYLKMKRFIIYLTLKNS